MVDPREVVIWSADVPMDVLRRVLQDGKAPVRFVKLDRDFLTRYGLAAIGLVQSWGYEVFADAKIVEIPVKSLGIAGQHLECRPWMLNCMTDIVSTAYMGSPQVNTRDGLRRFADACLGVGTKPCGVTVLTSKTIEVVTRQYNGRTPIEQVLVYAEWLLEAGFTDMVCSPLEAEAIRREPRFDGLDLNTPGIRLPEHDAGDQARTGTPRVALEAGATRLVIGRPLTEGDFAENFGRIAADILGE